MSKSLGNFTTLPDLLDAERPPRLPAAGAAGPLPLADRGDARDPRRRREGAGPAGRAGPAVRRSPTSWPDAAVVVGPEVTAATDVDADAVAAFRARMDDDLDTPGALAAIFDLVRRANSAADAGDAEAGRRARPTTAALLCGGARPAAPSGARRRGRRGDRRAGAGARRGPRLHRTTPGPTPCGTSWWPGLDRRGHDRRDGHPPS